MDAFIGEIRVVGFNFAPTGWALCNGQLVPISQNTALFSILGTQYGGDGKSTFALPNIQSQAVVGPGQGPGLSNYAVGELGGAEALTLLSSEIPAHSHQMLASPDPAEVQGPAPDRSLARTAPGFAYQTDTQANLTTFAGQAVAPAGGGLPHTNMPPVLVLNYVIALQGIFPQRP